MFGVILLTNPNWILFWRNTSETGYNPEDYPNFGLGVIMALCSSSLSALCYIYMRKLGTVVNPTATNFHFGLITIAIALPCMLIFDSPKQMTFDYYDRYVIMVMLGIMVTGFFSQWGANCALAIGRTGPIASINYLQIVLAWSYGVTLFDQKIVSTDIVGTFLVAGCTTLGYLIEMGKTSSR